jgi:PAS domain S-box-containing protein
VTNRNEEERRTHDSDRRFHALLESAPDAVVITDADGRIVLVNARTEDLFGYSRGRLLGGPVEQLVPERFRGPHVKHRGAYVAAPHARPMGSGLPLFGMRADGKEFPVAISLSSITLDEGLLIFSTIRDATRQLEIEQQLKSMNNHLARDNTELEALNKELEAFSYSVSHDLRAPLRAIDGFSQALVEDCGDFLNDEGRSHLARVRNAAQHMGRLIDDLLKLSRVARADINYQDVDLTVLAREIVEGLRMQEPERDVEVHIADGLTAKGDTGLLHVALDNLLANAWKFTAGRSPARIDFGRQVQDGRTVYYIRDNGAGFDMTYAHRLFSPFQRLHDAETFAGTGIGLAIVQRVINKHGGRIWATAEPDCGAVFLFSL